MPTPEPEADLTEADLLGLQEDVSKLQREYDDAVVVKHNLKNDVESCTERLKAATGLLQRYFKKSLLAATTINFLSSRTTLKMISYSLLHVGMKGLNEVILFEYLVFFFLLVRTVQYPKRQSPSSTLCFGVWWYYGGSLEYLRIYSHYKARVTKGNLVNLSKFSL